MGRKPKVQTRVERDTDEAIRRYMDDYDGDLSHSEAVRHLIRAGLAQKGHPVAATDGGNDFLEQIASPRTVELATVAVALSGGFMFVAAELVKAGIITGGMVAFLASTFFIITATVMVWLAALAQLALAQPLRHILPLIGGTKA